MEPAITLGPDGSPESPAAAARRAPVICRPHTQPD